MKSIALSISIMMNLMGVQSLAQDHAHHVKHNMILFGEADAYYASHLVYKKPHNFQVILKINLNQSTKTKVEAEMRAHPNDQFIYLLDQMDISQITQKPKISGRMFRTDADGTKHVIFEQVELNSDEYSIVYFDELPLSLSQSNISFSQKIPLQCAKDDQRPQCCAPISNCNY